MGHARDAIILVIVQLSDTVPVDTGSIILHIVRDMNDNGVAYICQSPYMAAVRAVLPQSAKRVGPGMVPLYARTWRS